MGNRVQSKIFEVNIKSSQVLASTIKSLKVLNPSRVMLTDRDPSRPQLAYAREILSQLSGVEVGCVYSLGIRGEGAGGEELSTYLNEAGKAGVQEVLIVSGEPKQRSFDSVAALYYLRQQSYASMRADSNLPKLSVAYNPYLPARSPISPGGLEHENKRLREKLASGLVSSVYFQLGEDADALTKGIELIKSLARIEIYAAILTPSVETIARLKANPWPGVFYHEFLHSVETAKNVNSRIEIICQQAGIGKYLCGAV